MDNRFIVLFSDIRAISDSVFRLQRSYGFSDDQIANSLIVLSCTADGRLKYDVRIPKE